MTDDEKPFNERYGIDFTRHLPEFDSSGGEAFMATDLENSDRALFARVQNPEVPQRSDLVELLTDKPLPNLFCPLEQAVVTIESASGPRDRLVTIIERPLGGSLLAASKAGKISEAFIRGAFLRNILVPLGALHQLENLHRSIRPSNLFFKDGNQDEVVIGDGFSTPPALDQPAVYEPLEYVSVPAHARGKGDKSADMFALGATILSLFLGEQLVDERSGDEIYMARIAQGSYRALAKGRKLPVALEDLLRGLLSDDPEARWTLIEVVQWLGGITPGRRIAFKDWTLINPVSFKGSNYSDRRLLTIAFAASPNEAAEYLRRQDIGMWVRKTLVAEAFSERQERLVDIQRGDDSYDARENKALICRFSAVLDPYGPIRFRSLVLSMDGLPGAIAHYFSVGDKESLNDLKLLIGSGLFRSILDLAMEKNPAAAEVRKNLADYSETVNSQRLSLGMENVLYDMNPSLPCLSPKFTDKWVSNAGDAIRELDRVVGETGSANNVFDRHLSSFCVHKEDDLRPLFLVLPNADIPRGQQALQLLRVFGKVQRQQALGPLKHLSEHLAKALKSLVGDLRNQNRRERIDGQLLGSVGSGDMNRIYREMNLENEQNSDEEEFQTARSGYAFLDGERRRFKATIEAGGPQAQKVGQAAALILGLVVLGFSLVNMLGRL